MALELFGVVGENTTILNVITGLIAAIAAAINAIAASLLIRETRLQRAEQNRPDVVLSLHPDDEKPWVKNLSIRNIGTRTGFNIRFFVDSSPMNLNDRPFSELYLFQKGLANLAPGEKYTFILALLSGASFEKQVKDTLIVRVSYDDIKGKTYTATYSFDLRVFEFLGRIKK